MAHSTNSNQTCLEKRGMSERKTEMARSDYNMENQYSVTHADALSDGDAQGKGTGHGGHTHFLPDCTDADYTSNKINYSNFDTSAGGGCFDIKGRNGIGGRERCMAISIYNEENQYGSTSVDTTENRNDGQYYVGQRIGNSESTCG
jgi:hypothetical protein